MSIINNLEQYNFCLDKKDIHFTRVSSSAKIRRIKLIVEISVGNENKTFTTTYDIPYFQDKVRIDVGDKVQNYFIRFANNLLNGNFQNRILKPAKIQISAEELDKNFVSVSNSEIIGNYYFYPGKRPRAYPILTNYPTRRRVNGSKVLIPYIAREINPASWGLISRFNETIEAKSVATLKITESEMNFPQSKRIGNVDVITFPDTRNVINVQWLNQNLVPDWASFTGEYKISTAFAHSISKDVFDNQKKKFETDKSKTLKINTGFILKAEIPMIEELMQSPICYIEIENRMLQCIPNGEKMGDEDSTSQLIEFDLEFLILNEIWR